MKQRAWETLAAEARACKKCDLGCEPSEIDPHVFGGGNLDASICFVAGAPDLQEVRQQKCLTSESKGGAVFDRVLKSLGLVRSQAYVCNALICHPPNNKDPEPYQSVRCREYLIKQVSIVRPQLIVSFGKHAADAFLYGFKITKDHGKIQKAGIGIDVFPLFHFAYIGCYSPPIRREEFKQDLRALFKIINERNLR